MAGITIAQAIDLGRATLESFKQDALQMTLKHQTYEVLNKWFPKARLDSGDRIVFHVSLKDTGNAQHVRMYETDTPNVANVVEEGKIEWTHFQNSFSYSVKEINMNKNNKVRIFNLLKSRRDNMYREAADALEEAAWKTPISSADDRTPHGIPAWLVQPGSDPSGAVGAFDGYLGNYWADTALAYSEVANIACSATENIRWANYYEDHNNALDDTLLKRLRRSFRKTKFQTPLIAKQAIDPESGFSNFRLYTNSNVLDEIEEIATKSDDKLGADLGKYAGATIFKGIPFVYVDALDATKTYVYGKNPIFGVNHNHFHPVVLEGENFRINPPMSKVGQHNVLTVYLDLTYGYVCDNRRAGGFLISEYEGT